jgi:adenylate cyclase
VTEDAARLLIVDDNKVSRLLLARSIEMLGHKIVLAENGRIGLEKLRSGTFDLLLLDIEMPEMDGFEVLQHLKADRHLRDLPVIVTSSVEGIENIVRCIRLGAEDYLPKPINQTLLKARIDALLEKKRLRDQLKELVRRFATSEVVDELMDSGFALGGRRVHASVLFCDIQGFTAMAERQQPEETIDLLNTYYTLMFDAISGHCGIVNQIIGDGIMALFGAPLSLDDCAGAAVRAALEMIELMDTFNRDRATRSDDQIKIGVGIATGDVIAGYTGTQSRATYTCVGDTVNIAARLEAYTRLAGCNLLIDATTARLIEPTLPCVALGDVELKGKQHRVEIFAVPVGSAADASGPLT